MSWPTVTLREETSLITKGTTPTSLGHAFTDRGVPFLRAQNLVGGTVSVEADPMFVSSDTNDALKRSKIRANDVLISIAGTIGRAAIVPSEALEMNCNQAVAIVRPSDKVDRKFLLYWLSSNDALSQMSKGKVTGVISNLSLGQIGQLKIPLPPLEEQRRIAAILDQADALRRLRHRALDRLNTLGQAIFHEMFERPENQRNDWERTLLADLVLDDDRINYGVVQPGDHDPEGVPIIRVADLSAPFLEFSTVKRISPKIDANYGRSRLRGGELLIGCVGSIGTTVVAPQSFEGSNIARAVARVPVDKTKSRPRFIAEQLRSQRIQNYFKREVRLVAQPTLNIKQIRETEIILPPKELQGAFVARVKEIELKSANYVRALSSTDALFASLQYRAFRGEL